MPHKIILNRNKTSKKYLFGRCFCLAHNFKRSPSNLGKARGNPVPWNLLSGPPKKNTNFACVASKVIYLVVANKFKFHKLVAYSHIGCFPFFGGGFGGLFHKYLVPTSTNTNLPTHGSHPNHHLRCAPETSSPRLDLGTFKAMKSSETIFMASQPTPPGPRTPNINSRPYDQGL